MTTIAAQARPFPRVAFAWLAVGIVMAQIDLRLNGFDLLPDVVGYVFVAATAYQLRALGRTFAAAAVCAALVAPLSVASLDRPTGSIASKTGDAALDAVLALADVVILWCVCTGVLRAAADAGDRALADTARSRRLLVVVVAAIWLLSPVLGPVLAGLPAGPAVALLIAYAVAAVAALVLLVGLLRGAGRSLESAPGHAP